MMRVKGPAQGRLLQMPVSEVLVLALWVPLAGGVSGERETWGTSPAIQR